MGLELGVELLAIGPEFFMELSDELHAG